MLSIFLKSEKNTTYLKRTGYHGQYKYWYWHKKFACLVAGKKPKVEIVEQSIKYAHHPHIETRELQVGDVVFHWKRNQLGVLCDHKSGFWLVLSRKGNLLEGKMPDGQQLGRLRDGKLEHRAGLDLTFSAPKSVSILAEVGGDKRLFAAQDKAVKTALTYLEKNTVQTRVQAKGQQPHIQNTGSLVAALFQHDTSRNQDPQLHTHCILMNMTQTADGKWRSLTNEQVYECKMTLGMIYRAELAYEIKRLGYEVEVNQNGFFEVRGVPKELMEIFSSRRKEIEAAIERFDLKGAAGAAKATLNTRKSKQNLERDALKPAWQTIAREQGIDLRKL